MRLERIVSKNNDVLRSNKGGVKGEGIVAELGLTAQLRYAEPREHCMLGLSAHPTPWGSLTQLKKGDCQSSADV